ncbi:hypothetical protein SLA2020_500110 [Shorea laevis]
MAIANEVVTELETLIRVYRDGSVERSQAPIVPPSLQDPETGVSSKDITISANPPISARIYLPNLSDPSPQKLPVLVYFHGGGFCVESAFNLTETTFTNRLVHRAKVVAVSIEYRLAPEHPLPIAFEDCWAGLQWVAAHAGPNGINEEPWLSYADFERLCIGGDSAGASLAHYVVMRAGKECLPNNVKISRAFYTHPYFWGSEAVGSEPTENREKLLPYKVWIYLYSTVPGGVDCPMINPVAPGAPSLAVLGCSKLLVSVSEKDLLWSRGISFYNAVKESGWKGEAELIEVEGEGHAFHIVNYESESAKKFIVRLASFLK